MIFRPEQVRLMALGLPAVPANGGGGKSDSTTSTATTNADQRNSVGSGVGATASSGGSVTLNVNQLDGGAIAQAFGLGHDALQFAAQEGTASMSASAATATAAINGMYSDVQSTQQAYADATKQVVSAYQDAKTGNQKTMLLGVLVVAGLAVAMPFLAREAK
jgi:hypothetical protein